MTQYWTDIKKHDEILQYCLDNFECVHLFIRLAGSWGGTRLCDAEMKGRKLSFKTTDTHIQFYIDDCMEFEFLKDFYNKGFSIEYRRNDGFHIPYFYADRDNPNDPQVPNDCLSVLRMMYEHTLVEISFKNKIPLFLDEIDEGGNFRTFHVKERVE